MTAILILSFDMAPSRRAAPRSPWRNQGKRRLDDKVPSQDLSRDGSVVRGVPRLEANRRLNRGSDDHALEYSSGADALTGDPANMPSVFSAFCWRLSRFGIDAALADQRGRRSDGGSRPLQRLAHLPRRGIGSGDCKQGSHGTDMGSAHDSLMHDTLLWAAWAFRLFVVTNRRRVQVAARKRV
jgi:hypothetical protein